MPWAIKGGWVRGERPFAPAEGGGWEARADAARDFEAAVARGVAGPPRGCRSAAQHPRVARHH